MLGIGEGELVLIVLFAFMIFGPDKLPGMGRTLGRVIRQFRDAQEGFTEVVQANIVDPATEAISDNPKRPNRNRAAEVDDDADADLPEGEDAPRPKRTETFAERKKRLAAEKAAREAKEAERPEGGSAPAGEDADAAPEATEAPAAGASESDESAEKPSEKPARAKKASAKDAERQRPSAADLYSMRRPSRTEADAAGADESVPEAPVAPADQPAPDETKEA